MSAAVLVGYATRYGSTQEVAETVAATLRDCGLVVDIRPLREARTLTGYSAWAGSLAKKLQPDWPRF